MNPELAEYLAAMEAKLNSLLQDIQNIRAIIQEPQNPTTRTGEPTFFEALRAEDPPQSRVNRQ